MVIGFPSVTMPGYSCLVSRTFYTITSYIARELCGDVVRVDFTYERIECHCYKETGRSVMVPSVTGSINDGYHQ